MINLEKMAEQLLLNTVKIKTANGSGTGFIISFVIDEKEVLILVTNSHVVNGNGIENVEIAFHTSEEKLDENLYIEASLEWNHHNEYDLCFSYLYPIFYKIKEKYGDFPKIRCITEEYFLKDQNLNLLEEVTMVGYPIGLHDEKYNFPIFRKGYTASHPMLDFNGEKIGVVDMACFPGSSGSPIFILNEGSFSSTEGIFLGNRMIFLGILYSGPVYNAKGKLEMRKIDLRLEPIPSVKIMTNLGCYIKAEVILDFKKKIFEQINKSKDE